MRDKTVTKRKPLSDPQERPTRITAPQAPTLSGAEVCAQHHNGLSGDLPADHTVPGHSPSSVTPTQNHWILEAFLQRRKGKDIYLVLLEKLKQTIN